MASTLGREGYYLRQLHTKMEHKSIKDRRIPILYGDGYAGSAPLLKLEYIENSVEDYLVKELENEADQNKKEEKK
jgi:hypothetical protein